MTPNTSYSPDTCAKHFNPVSPVKSLQSAISPGHLSSKLLSPTMLPFPCIYPRDWEKSQERRAACGMFVSPVLLTNRRSLCWKLLSKLQRFIQVDKWTFIKQGTWSKKASAANTQSCIVWQICNLTEAHSIWIFHDKHILKSLPNRTSLHSWKSSVVHFG